MNLKVLLPFRTFADKTGVTRVIAETRDGSWGLLPRRRDCTAALAPGILTYESESEGMVYLAIDEGVLIKRGAEVLVAVRRAIGGADLSRLHEAVQREFRAHNEAEQGVRAALGRIEGDFVGRILKFHHER